MRLRDLPQEQNEGGETVKTDGTGWAREINHNTGCETRQ